MSHNSPRHATIARENIILLTEVGSRLHGVAIDGTDDHDEMGVCIPPPSCITGLDAFEQYTDRWHADGTRIPEGQRSGPGDTDHTVYSLQKYMRLAANGNPTVLMPLYAQDEDVYKRTELGRQLQIGHRKIISKRAGARFMAYLQAQQRKMLSGSGRTNRPELVDQFGFDTKFAYHALRLAVQGEQLMRDEWIPLPMPQEWREHLRAVRSGHFTREQVLGQLAGRIDALYYAIIQSTLPDDPDIHHLNEWLHDMHWLHWEEKGYV